MEKANTPLVRVAIVGPESTGKTTLAQELAAHYNTIFVSEYAREYIAKLNKHYTLKDIVAISKGQMELENSLAQSANKILICDTNLVVTKIWAEHAYGKCPEWIINNLQLTIHNYKLHLLTYPDTIWTPDAQREHPHLREFLFNKYITELERLKVHYRVIRGVGNKRQEHAVKFINQVYSPGGGGGGGGGG